VAHGKRISMLWSEAEKVYVENGGESGEGCLRERRGKGKTFEDGEKRTEKKDGRRERAVTCLLTVFGASFTLFGRWARVTSRTATDTDSIKSINTSSLPPSLPFFPNHGCCHHVHVHRPARYPPSTLVPTKLPFVPLHLVQSACPLCSFLVFRSFSRLFAWYPDVGHPQQHHTRHPPWHELS
jgi:hypothetical protein